MVAAPTNTRLRPPRRFRRTVSIFSLPALVIRCELGGEGVHRARHRGVEAAAEENNATTNLPVTRSLPFAPKRVKCASTLIGSNSGQPL